VQIAVGLRVHPTDTLQQLLDELAALLFKRLLDLLETLLCVTVDPVLTRRLGAFILWSAYSAYLLLEFLQLLLLLCLDVGNLLLRLGLRLLQLLGAVCGQSGTRTGSGLLDDLRGLLFRFQQRLNTLRLLRHLRSAIAHAPCCSDRGQAGDRWASAARARVIT